MKADSLKHDRSQERGRRVRQPLEKTYNHGFNIGFNEGFDKGYESGRARGALEVNALFEGVSIVIPSYNQKELLTQCLDSIEKYTLIPHEVIVIDNGSKDGTESMLKRRAGIRYRFCTENLGFSGRVNQGLKMARGRNVLLLNNDVVVTAGWLTNLLACLNGRKRESLVGPVTNYISGEQLIETSYSSLSDMQTFASAYNRPDPAKWLTVGRLTGFCLLMRRDALERLGLFDEGFRIGNCEDDDFGLRARMLGIDLVVAKDTFIHHAGSASVKAMSDAFVKIYADNLAFYSQKWGRPDDVLQEVKAVAGDRPLKTVELYPTHFAARGPGGAVYWVEHGIRQRVEGQWSADAVRLSRFDLRQLAEGETLTAEQALSRLASLASTPSAYGSLAEGIMVRTSSGACFQSDRGQLRQLTGERTMTVWQLEKRPVFTITDEEAGAFPRGLPIISPPVLRAQNL